MNPILKKFLDSDDPIQNEAEISQAITELSDDVKNGFIIGVIAWADSIARRSKEDNDDTGMLILSDLKTLLSSSIKANSMISRDQIKKMVSDDLLGIKSLTVKKLMAEEMTTQAELLTRQGVTDPSTLFLKALPRVLDIIKEKALKNELDSNESRLIATDIKTIGDVIFSMQSQKN